MKYLLFALILLYSMVGMAQTDSTEIKLNRYKQLFMDGTINNREYEALRNKELGISKTEKPIDYNKLAMRNKKAGTGLSVVGGTLLVGGSVLAGIYGGNSVLFVPGVAMLCSSAPFIITAPICFAKYGKYKKRGTEIRIGTNGVALTF